MMHRGPFLVLFTLLGSGAAPAFAQEAPPVVASTSAPLEGLPWMAMPQHAPSVPEPLSQPVALPEGIAPASTIAPIPEVPMPAPSREEFIRALASAYTNNPTLRAEREALKVLDESMNEATAGFRPTIGAEYDKGRQRTKTGAINGWRYGDSETKAASFEQPLFRGGETIADMKSARSRIKAGRAMLMAAEQDVLFNAVQAYTDLAEKMALVQISNNNVAVLVRHRDVAQARFDAGELTMTDLSQAESRLARAQSDLTQAMGDMTSARATFDRVIGYPAGAVGIPEEIPALPGTEAEANEQALSAFPDLIAAMQEEKARDSDVNARIARILPTLSLVGTASRSEGGVFPGINEYDNDTLTLKLRIPLYQSGAEYSRIRAAKHERERAKFTAMDARNATTENVTRAWHDFQAALAVIASSESASRAAKTALEGVQREYEFGERTTLDVLDAEQEFFQSEVALVQARSNRVQQSYRVLAATGRLNAKELALPVEIYDPIAHYDDVKWLPIGF